MPDFTPYLVSRTTDNNPDTGNADVLIFAGTEAEMVEIANWYQLAGGGAPLGYGYKTNLARLTTGFFLTVHIPDSILYTTTWSLQSASQSVSIFWFPQVREFLGFGSTDISTVLGMREWLAEVAKINKAVDEVEHPTEKLTTATAFATTAEAAIIRYILHDSPYSDWKQPALQRRRVIPVGLAGVRAKLTGPPQLYSLDGIYNQFGLSDDYYDQAITAYDNLPVADPYTIWAWKLWRDDSESLIGSGKVQECRDFIFGRWSTITNTFIE